MIGNVKYEDVLSYSKELSASIDVINDLIKDEEFPELQAFLNVVNNYSRYLSNTVEINQQADEALSFMAK